MKQKSISELLEFGIINLDKPANYTSFQAAEIVGKMLGARKFSHFGTLDPKVTGVLPIALNRACKLTRWFMKKNKTYVGIMKLHKEVEEERLKKEMKKFVGKIIQKPPVKSRVKRVAREREVLSWEILEYDKKRKEVLFETEVEAGTYIRKLIHDLGLKLGVGAHMIELRRIKAGIFSEQDKNFVSLYELEKIKDKEEELKKIITPAEEAIKKIMPVIQVKEKSVGRLLTGKPIEKMDLKTKIQQKELEEEEVAVFSEKRFIEVAKVVYEDKIIARPEFVFN